MDNPKSNTQNVGALMLIALGVFFLLAQVFNFSILGALWPFFIILPGAAFLYFAVKGGKGSAGLAVPGAIITGTGGILLYQSVTGHWESWAYIWTLYPVFLGLALMWMGERTGKESEVKTGRGFVKYGLAAFLVMWAVFELVIFGGLDGALGRFVIPALLIGVGIYLLRRQQSGTHNSIFSGPVVYSKRKNDASPNGSDRLRKRIDEALDEINEDQ